MEFKLDHWKAWQEFYNSGNVFDYLNYVNIEKQESFESEKGNFDANNNGWPGNSGKSYF